MISGYLTYKVVPIRWIQATHDDNHQASVSILSIASRALPAVPGETLTS